MKFLFKIVALPIAGVLSLATSFCSFALAVSNVIFGIISIIVFLLALVTIFSLDRTMGVVWLAAAYIISPYGLPKIAEWLIKKIDGINGILKDFIFS